MANQDVFVHKVPKEDNPYWPLPKDYATLSPEGQRMARINACRQWILLEGTEEERAENLVASVNAFDRLYLQTEGGGFYPPFMWKPAPKFHDDILKGIATYKYNVIAAPRGHAKTFLMRKLMLCLLTTCPMFQITYCAASNNLVKKSMAALVRVWRINDAIFQDWAPEYGGRIIPGRGKAPFGFSGELHLSNNSSLFGTSAEARNRGDRPHLLILDDIEFDASQSTDMEIRREDVANLLFSVIMPMVINEGCKLVWVGTTISKRHFLYQAVSPKVDPKDRPREFKNWHRMFFKTLYNLEDGSQKALWPENHNEKRMASLKDSMGEARFNAEMMNDPDSDGAYTFPLSEQRHGYEFFDTDEFTLKDPWTSRAGIRYTDRDGILVEKPLVEFLQEAHIVQTLDWANSTESTSDYSAIVTSAYTPKGELFVLDVFADKITTNHLALASIRYARKWQAKVVGIESPNVSFHITHAIRTKFKEVGPDENGYFPRLEIIKTYKETKADRIESLQWRFTAEHGLIKLPFGLKSLGAWRMLFSQMSEFKAQAPNGGLTHDDVLDALAMAQAENIGVGLPRGPRAKVPGKNDIELAMAGSLHDERGEPRLAGFEKRLLSKEVLDAIIWGQRAKHTKFVENQATISPEWEGGTSYQEIDNAGGF